MQSFIGLALKVSEIIRGSLKTPPPSLKKKPGLNRVKVFDSENSDFSDRHF